MKTDLQGLETGTGYPPEEVADLRGTRPDDAEIAQVLADMIFNLDNLDAIASGSVIQGFEQFAVDALEAADRFDELDRAASAMGTFANSGAAPVASFTATPLTGNAPLTVSFASTSIDDDGDTLTATWDFGDGETGTGSPIFHEYTAAGTYTATLTISDGSATDTETTSITVDPTGTNRAPTAGIAYNPVAGDAPLKVTFESTSFDPDGDTLNVSWGFGDGETATGSPVEHTYTEPGNYTVSITVSDGSLFDTETVTVSVAIPNRPPTGVDDEIWLPPYAVSSSGTAYELLDKSPTQMGTRSSSNPTPSRPTAPWTVRAGSASSGSTRTSPAQTVSRTPSATPGGKPPLRPSLCARSRHLG